MSIDGRIRTITGKSSKHRLTSLRLVFTAYPSLHRIVECHKDSPFPLERDHDSRGEYSPRRTEFRRSLRPDILLYRGQPDSKLITTWRELFPSVSIIVCSENSRTEDGSGEDASPRTQRTLDAWKKRSEDFAKKFNYEIDNVGVHNMFEERTLGFRYRLHDGYESFSPGRRNQRLFAFRAVDEDRTLEWMQELTRSDVNEGPCGVVAECVSIPGVVRSNLSRSDPLCHSPSLLAMIETHATEHPLPYGHLRLLRPIRRTTTRIVPL